MGITKEHLLGQLSSFEAQHDQLVAQIQQVDGAARLCRALIGKLEREEDEAKAKGTGQESSEAPEAQ